MLGRLPILAALLAGCGGDPAAPADVSTKPANKDNPYDPATVSAYLDTIDMRLKVAGLKLRVAKAEFIADTSVQFASQTVIANDRMRGFGAEWVPGDPRRDGRIGTSYVFDPRQGSAPFTRNPDGSGLRQVQFPELEPYLEEGMSAWRGRTCSTAPIARVGLGANVDPDILDNLVFGSDGAGRTYSQVSDIVQGGWQSRNFFIALFGPFGDGVIGVTFTFYFVDDAGELTDIDRNGKADIGLAEIYYNTRFAWGASQAPNVVDFYSIITHETGHSLGLNHFGKVFVTKRDGADGIQIADIKYAPKAMMNAVYVTGRSELAGTDNSSFCQIWASVH
jgi:hypothetical protein